MRAEVQQLALQSRGFLSFEEGQKLFELARAGSKLGPCVEVGSYCGKSALFLAEGCRATGKFLLFSIDHHRGSAEQQLGEQYFDPDVFDPALGRVNSWPHFLRTIERAGLQQWVVPMLGESARIAQNWPEARLGLVFIDGGHSTLDVASDYHFWSRYVSPGGSLCFHDVYPNSADGGQAPLRVFERARRAPGWCYVGLFGSLGVLERT